MRCTVHVVIETESGTHTHEIAHIEREPATLEPVGLTLAEVKALIGIPDPVWRSESS